MFVKFKVETPKKESRKAKEPDAHVRTQDKGQVLIFDPKNTIFRGTAFDVGSTNVFKKILCYRCVILLFQTAKEVQNASLVQFTVLGEVESTVFKS